MRIPDAGLWSATPRPTPGPPRALCKVDHGNGPGLAGERSGDRDQRRRPRVASSGALGRGQLGRAHPGLVPCPKSVRHVEQAMLGPCASGSAHPAPIEHARTDVERPLHLLCNGYHEGTAEALDRISKRGWMRWTSRGTHRVRPDAKVFRVARPPAAVCSSARCAISAGQPSRRARAHFLLGLSAVKLLAPVE